MATRSQIEGDVCIVTPEGQLDALTGPALSDLFQEKLKAHKNLIIDFSKLEFLSSAGLRVLLSTVKDARRIGGDLRLTGVKEDVGKVLSVSGFDRILKIYPDLQEAKESYS